MKRLLVLALLVCSLSGPAWGGMDGAPGAKDGADSKSALLMTQEYYPMARGLIANAEESILVVMYFIIPSGDAEDPVGVLIGALGSARARGVEVRVILEDGKARENQEALRRLAGLGIPVYYDSPASLLHTKAVVVDREVVLVGSANWSNAAFWKNQEISAVLRSREEARRIHALVDAMVLRKAEILPAPGNTVPMGEAFLLDARFGARLVAGNAVKTFEVYLELVGGYGDTFLKYRDTIPISKSKLGHVPVFQESRRKSLAKLEDFGLVRRLGRGEGAEIVALEGATIAVPASFWEFGWYQRLSLTAKYMYLVSLREAALSTKNPRWFRSQKDLAERYHVSEWTISRGLLELERANLLDVERSVSEGPPFDERDANVYTLRVPYDPALRAEAMDALRLRHGDARWKLARDVAEILNDPNDVETLEALCDLIALHGPEKVRKAALKIKGYKAGSGLRSLKRLAEEI